MLAGFSAYHPLHVIPCLSSLETRHKQLYHYGVHQLVAWKKRTNDEAGNFVVPQYDRLKFQLCVFESFIDVQTVEIDRSIGAALTPQRDQILVRMALESRCDWPQYLVLLIKDGRRRLFVQTLHCTVARSSILFMHSFGTEVTPFTRLLC